MKIFLIRHGETDGNALDLAQGHYDQPLNHRGIAQAQLLAERLSSWGIDAVYASDSTRALQTAQPLLKLRPELEVQKTPALREKFYGQCENQPWQRLRIDHAQIFRQLLDPEIGSDVRFPDGETDREHMQRVASCIDNIIARHHQDANILVFSHGGSIKAAAAHICKLRLIDKWCLKTDNTGISSITSKPTWRDDGWQIAFWNDTNHLAEART